MTGSEEVVVASTAPGLQISSSAANSACLTARSSTTASTTRSQSARSSSAVVPVIRPSTSSRAASVELAALRPPCPGTWSTSADDLATFSSVRARTMTSYPLLAQTSTMPVAIVPVPTTPIV